MLWMRTSEEESSFISLVLSMMDDTTATKHNNNNNKRLKLNKAEGNGDDSEEEYDVDAWDTLSKSFKQVQTVLDNNRELIQRVNENHRSKIPDNMSKNVELIREINGNISKVVSIYSDLSAKFSNVVGQRRGRMKNGNVDSSED